MSAGLVNHARGEVGITVSGRTIRLCVTLGALAELEAAFGVEGLAALAERLGRLNAADLLVTLEALAKGAGEPAPNLAAAEPKAAARAVAQAFRAALADDG